MRRLVWNAVVLWVLWLGCTCSEIDDGQEDEVSSAMDKAQQTLDIILEGSEVVEAIQDVLDFFFFNSQNNKEWSTILSLVFDYNYSTISVTTDLGLTMQATEVHKILSYLSDKERKGFHQVFNLDC